MNAASSSDPIFDIAVIGAGIVGLAVAKALLEKHPALKIVVLEKESGECRHQSGHNSGVLHAGVYYKPGSLKARLCVEGRRQMLAYLQQKGIPYELTGKLIVATNSDEVGRLKTLEARALQNGLQGLRWLDAKALKQEEASVDGLAALLVPETGIVDYRRVAKAYVGDILRMKGQLFFDWKLQSIARLEFGFELQGGSRPIRTRKIVNCAGLYSDHVARLCGFQTSAQIIPFRGEYYQLSGESKLNFRHLIYPVPNPDFPFLGVHLTRQLDGSVECGPNAVLALKREGYSWFSFSWAEVWPMLLFSGFRRLVARHWKYGLGELHRSLSKRAFARALAKLAPRLQMSDLRPGGAGVRAQAVQADGGLVDDFLLLSDQTSFHVLNAPSPAATASLTIAGEIVLRMEQAWGRLL